MATAHLAVRRYRRPDGVEPFTRWVSLLKDGKARARIDSRLDRLEVGNWGDAKSLSGGLYELRIDVGPGYRVYLGRKGARMVLLLCGGSKSTQRCDIELARNYWEDYNGRTK